MPSRSINILHAYWPSYFVHFIHDQSYLQAYVQNANHNHDRGMPLQVVQDVSGSGSGFADYYKFTYGQDMPNKPGPSAHDLPAPGTRGLGYPHSLAPQLLHPHDLYDEKAKLIESALITADKASETNFTKPTSERMAQSNHNQTNSQIDSRPGHEDSVQQTYRPPTGTGNSGLGTLGQTGLGQRQTEESFVLALQQGYVETKGEGGDKSTPHYPGISGTESAFGVDNDGPSTTTSAAEPASPGISSSLSGDASVGTVGTKSTRTMGKSSAAPHVRLYKEELVQQHREQERQRQRQRQDEQRERQQKMAKPLPRVSKDRHGRILNDPKELLQVRKGIYRAVSLCQCYNVWYLAAHQIAVI